MAIARHRLVLAAAALAVFPAAANDLGTLFHSPEERERLDKLRRGEATETAAVPAGKREVTGFVRRSDGRGTVFINGVPVVVAAPSGTELFDPEQVRSPGRGEVKIERAPAQPVKR